MQEVSSTFNTDSSSQALADAALAYLSPPVNHLDLPSAKAYAPTETDPSCEAAQTHASSSQHGTPDTAVSNEPWIKAEIESPLALLPSLLRYVDHVLTRDTDRHNHPPYAAQTCVSCNIQWDKADTPSTFLPLTPCNHWIHYRCLIWLATREGLHKNKCLACKKQLFEWDGINALTLATRTSLPMSNEQFTTINPGTYALVTSDRTVYEQECQFIDNTIDRRFFNQLTKPSGFADNSPDLVQCFNDVINDLRLLGRPHSKWLKWSTNTGSLLFGMLIAIKMRRFLLESHGRIRQTEAWTAWKDGCRLLQKRIMEEVHKE